MPDDIQRLAVLIESNTKSYENAMKKMQSTTDRRLKAIKKSVDGLDKRFARMGRNVNRVAGIFGVAFSGRAVFQFVKSSIEMADRLGDTADKLGINVEALQEYRFAASQVGVAQNTLDMGLQRFIRRAAEAATGTGEAKNALKELGVDLTDANGKLRPTEELLLDVADGFAGIDSQAQKVRLAFKLFDSEGVALVNLFGRGREAVQRFLQKARDLGIVLSEETVRRTGEAADELDILSKVFQVAGVNLTKDFMPAITAFANLVTSPDFQAGIRTTAEGIGKLIDLIADNIDVVERLVGAFTLMKLGGRVAGRYGALGGAAIGAASPEIRALFSGETPIGNQATKSDFGAPVAGEPPANKPTLGLGVDFDAIDRQAKKFQDLTLALQAQLTQLELNDREQAIANELARLGTDATDEQKGAIAALAAKVHDHTLSLQRARAASNFFAETTAEGFSALITQIDTGNAALDSFINKLIEAAAQAFLLGTGPLANLFGLASATTGVAGGVLGALFGGFRAGGGPVSAGRAFVVGERGPEIFVPQMSGRVVPTGAGAAPSRIVIEFVEGPVFGGRVREISGPVAVQVSQGVTAKAEQTRQRQALTHSPA